MNYSICLDQFSTNFNVANLSTNGFSIYTNLDNFTTPIAQNIPYQDLFSPPIGNCPYIANLPQGATQLVVIDACSSMPTNIASIFNPSSTTAGNLLTTCCYAIIDVPVQSISWCDTADLTFDLFSASFVGQIIAGNLNSNIGAVTSYKIGWYKDGDYSTPEFTSGYGNAFIPYQLTHPLAANTAPYVTAGNWEGIIHDIAINGVTYSSVSGSANGTPIPFESCFGTIVISPLQCDNGTFPLPYTHQKSFTAVGNGSTPPPISTTFQLDDTTNYFAYKFRGYNVYDELEIKFIPGDPNNTGDPTLYSQPIYLEKAQIGLDIPNSNISTIAQITNNTYPKKIKNIEFKKILTLTNISRSANPSLPDRLDITITPNPTNNQTSWDLYMQCLDTIDCSDCLDPFSKIKISNIFLDRLCCGQQILNITNTGSCNGSTQIWTQKRTGLNTYTEGYTSGWSDLNNTFSPLGNTYTLTSPLTMNTNSYPGCAIYGIANSGYQCAPSTANSIINYHKSVTTVNGSPQGIISMSFNNQTDYLHYKNDLINAEALLQNNIGNIVTDPTNIKYYTYYTLSLPYTTTPCGDGTFYNTYNIHRTVYPSITYVENPANNYWSITIPLPIIANGIIPSTCSNCYTIANQVKNAINNPIIITANNMSITNIYGVKSNNPFGCTYSNSTSPNIVNNTFTGNSSLASRKMPIYSWETLPFISSSNGWVNLPTLGGNPCPSLVSSSMPRIIPTNPTYAYENGARYDGFEFNVDVIFPNLTASSDWFQLYSRTTSSLGSAINPPGTMIYQYTSSIGTVYSSSYFQGGSPTVTIDPWPNC